MKKILEQQESYQINKQDKKMKEFSSIVTDFPLQSVQMDIMVYDRYAFHIRSMLLQSSMAIPDM